MKVIDLFSGICGFSLAASWLNWQTILFCEQDKFCQKIINKHFPGTYIHDDIKTITKEIIYEKTGIKSTDDIIITAGFPCQSFSVAGKQEGDLTLWKETLRVVRQIKPSWGIFENVHGLVSIKGGLLFNEVCTDLEDAGYEVQPFIIPAASKNAPHKRDRVWIIAFNTDIRDRQEKEIRPGRDNGNTAGEKRSLQATRPNSNAADTTKQGLQRNSIPETQKLQLAQGINDDSDTTKQGLQRKSKPYAKKHAAFKCNHWNENWYTVALRTCVRGVSDGLPRKLDRVNRLKALGNSIVPQIAYEFMKVIDIIHYDN